MKKTLKAFWLALMGVMWLMFMATACHKTPPDPEPDLPPETQTGAGTIGCYINGKPWWPKPYLAIGTSPYLEVTYGGTNPGLFYLDAFIPNGTNSSLLTIVVQPWAKKGDNKIWYNPSPGGNIFLSFDTTAFARGCGQFRLDTLKTRRLTITKLDTVGVGIISGTFEFTAFNSCGDTLRFTQGRFDY
jgi:hypothetical protein